MANNVAPNMSPSSIQEALLKSLKALATLPAQMVFYGSAALTVAATSGLVLPDVLGGLVAAIGANSLSAILESIARGESVSDEEIRQKVSKVVNESGIDRLVHSNEFQRAIAHVFRRFDLVKYAVERGEYNIVAILTEQFSKHQGLISELKGELHAVQGQLNTLSTREQSEEIIKVVQQIADRLEAEIPFRSNKSIKRLRIFVASPSDLNDERNRLKKTIDELNEPGGIAEQFGVVIQLLGWEQAISGMGLAENVILDQMPVEDWDIFVGVLWTRFGNPTGNIDSETGLPFDSGTEEEFLLGHRSWKERGRPHILFYRRSAPPASLDDLDLEQYGKVRTFLENFKTTAGHPGLFTSYFQPEDFERRVRQDLIKLIPRLLKNQQSITTKEPTTTHQSNDYFGIQHSFLQWTLRVHSRLELRGIKVQGQLPTVPLDRVFVALKGDRTDPSETNQSRLLLEDQMIEWENHIEWKHRSRDEKRLLRWYILANSPYMPSLIERDRPSVLGERKVEILNLADAFRRYRWLVVLGDPGSGKTTLARWLALHLSQAYAKREKRVTVPINHVDPAAGNRTEVVDLGVTRMPLLLRVSDFAEERRKNSSLQLIDYLGSHPWLGERPAYEKGHPKQGETIPSVELNQMIRLNLRNGNVVVILDGLDEITRGVERENIVRAIEQFVRDWVNAPNGWNPLDELEQPWRWRIEDDIPAESGGNQLIVTSRIAGYHAYPLNGRIVHFTVEPMGQAGIDRFCEAWTHAVQQLMARPDESQREIDERASRQAESLKLAIHDPSRPSVEEMASNPLLLTILALVHYNTQARLPEQRVRLYQIAVENLVDVWRETELTEDEVVNILAPVAAHIHSTYSTGLIPEPELRDLVTTQLAIYKGMDPENPPLAFNAQVEKFLDVVREQVGMLAARSEYLYGFLHLTFQEYLAARYLVRDPEKTLERILEKTSDPRWREPILLALGFAMLNWGIEARERLLQNLLDAHDPLADLLPRNDLLVAAALPEFVHMPSKIISQVVRRLIVAYADRNGIGRFEFLHQQIERALTRLRRGNAIDVFDQVLLDILKANAEGDGRQDLQLAVASLIHRNKWYTRAFAEAFLDLLSFENESWDFPATRALQTIAKQSPELLSERRIPFRQFLSQTHIHTFIQSDREWQRLLLFLCGGLNDDGQFDPKAIYLQPAIAQKLEENLTKQSPALELISVFESLWQSESIPLDQSVESVIGLVALGYDILPLLEASKERPSHVAQVQRLLDRLLKTQGDVRDIHGVEELAAVCIPLIGKLPELLAQAIETARQIQDEYSRARALVGLAPHLPAELLAQALEAARQIQDEYSRASALVGLAPHLPAELKEEVLQQALQAARQIQDEYSRASALVGLAPHLPAELLAPALEAARQIQDEYSRARALVGLAPHLPAELLAQALEAARQTQDGSSRASVLKGLAPHLPAELKEEVLQQALEAARQIQDGYSRASALVGLAPHLPAELKEEVLQQALQAARQIQDEYSRASALEGLAPHLPAELLAQALEAARQIQNEYSRASALEGLAPHLPAELLAQALEAARQIQDGSSRASVLKGLAPHLPAELLAQALEAARQIQNEYSRASALEGLAPHLPAELLAQALEAARQIKDETSRARALVGLAPHLPAELLAQALEAARQTQDETSRARALVGLAPHLPAELKEEVLQQALEAARQIQDETSRARALAGLAPHLPAELKEEVLQQALQAARQTQDEYSRASVLSTLAEKLIEYPALWSSFWIQIRLDLLRLRPYTIAETTLQKLKPAFPWDLLLDTGQRDTRTLQILQTAKSTNTLPLTELAIQAIQALVNDGQIDSACAILHLGKLSIEEQHSDGQNSKATDMILSAWLSHSDPRLHSLATLLRAEEDLTASDLATFSEILSGDDDRSRYRVNLALVKNRSATEVGSPFVEELACQFIKNKLNPEVRMNFYWALLGLKHNDVSAMSHWLEKIGDDEISRTIVETVGDIDQACWERLFTVMQSPTYSEKGVFLDSVYGLLDHGKVPDGSILALRNWLYTLASGDSSDSIQALWCIGFLPRLVEEDITLLKDLLVESQMKLDTGGYTFARLANRSSSHQFDHALNWLYSQSREAKVPVDKIYFAGAWLFQQILKDPMKPEFFQPLPWLLHLSNLLDGNEERMLDAVLYAGADNHWLWLDYHTKIVRIAQALITEKSLPIFMQRFQEKLSSARWKTVLLATASAVAEKMPAAFLRLANSAQFEQDLIRSMDDPGNHFARRFSFSTLTHLPRVSLAAMKVIHMAMRDVRYVQQHALEAITHFRQIDGDLANAISETLFDSSPAVAYAGAQILEALGRSETTSSEQRQQIVLSLASAIRDPRSQRDVYLWEEIGQNIRYAGQLDQVFHRALVSIAESAQL